MDIAADLGGAIKRLEDLAKNIFENGAPHQKSHGADLAAVVQAAKAGPGTPADTSDLEAQLKIAQGNLTAEMAKTDTANAMVKTLQGQLAESEAVIAERDTTIATAEGTIATLTAELAAAKAQVPPASGDAAQKS